MILLMRLEKRRTSTLANEHMQMSVFRIRLDHAADQFKGGGGEEKGREIIRQQSEKVEKERSQSQTNH